MVYYINVNLFYKRPAEVIQDIVITVKLNTNKQYHICNHL